MKLGGWQRIGIVLSGLWLFGYGGPYFIDRMDAADDSASNAQRLCSQYGDPNEDCSNRYRETIGEYQGAALITWSITVLPPIPIAWGLAYAATWAFRWIKRGFAQTP